MTYNGNVTSSGNISSTLLRINTRLISGVSSTTGIVITPRMTIFIDSNIKSSCISNSIIKKIICF